jgi:hypothetical protein
MQVWGHLSENPYLMKPTRRDGTYLSFATVPTTLFALNVFHN